MTTALPPISERAFQAQVLQLARICGWKAQHHWSERHSPAGWPDLTLHRDRDGRLLFVEVKRETGRVSDAQRDWLDRLSRVTDVQARLWRPSMWDEIVEMLR